MAAGVFGSDLGGFCCFSSSLLPVLILLPMLDPNDEREFLAEAISEEVFPEGDLFLVSAGLDGVACWGEPFSGDDDKVVPNILARIPPELERVRRLPASVGVCWKSFLRSDWGVGGVYCGIGKARRRLTVGLQPTQGGFYRACKSCAEEVGRV